jgi:hypothetical protein
VFFTASQLVAHLVGDYIFQTHWMAVRKTEDSFAALVHAVTYSLPFLLLTTSWMALMGIIITHFVIDRWRLARHLTWFKNQVVPRKYRFSWAESSTGYHPDIPPVITVILLFITDNTIHIIVNGLAITLL